MMASSVSPLTKRQKTVHVTPKENGELHETKTEEKEFKFSDSPSLDQLRMLQNQFAKERDWDQFHQPRNLLLAMVGEVGEVAELFQWKGEVKEGLPDWSEKDKKHLEQELSDVLIYLVRLSEKCHIDLPKAAIEKIALNGKKYPAEKVQGSSKKYTEYN
ncbi:dCTP pyrophosphatase 1-like [Apostichopus japonicus]|uniref:dCTP pyrophosphatase 1-like n=1 Tax=Stichopus japonicus TaxID=307972 RepID=UPI003AB58940